MPFSRPSILLAALAFLAGAPAFAQSPPAGAADQAMMMGMDKMQHDMSGTPMTGDADHDFVAMMKPHHAGAIDMAKAELQYGKDPELRALARDIIAAQDKEIAQMTAWQAAHPAP